MSLYTALRAAHRRGGFGHVELLPVTQQKSLALTRRKPAQRLLDVSHDLCLLELRSRVGRDVGVRLRVERFERIVLLVPVVFLSQC